MNPFLNGIPADVIVSWDVLLRRSRVHFATYEEVQDSPSVHLECAGFRQPPTG